MRTTRILVIVTALIASAAVVGAASGVEIGAGTEPSISFAVTWDVSPSFTVALSLGAIFEQGTQTGSFTVQSASYTVGLEARYVIQLATPLVRPYLGFGAYLQMGDAGTSMLMSSSIGVQVRMLPGIYLFSEGTAIVPILDPTAWFWRLKLGVGFRFF